MRITRTEAQPTIFAGIGNRATALFLDLALLIFVAALTSNAWFSHQFVFLLLAFFYFAGMPLSPLQGTPGKWICRIKLCDRFGRPLTLRSSVVRTAAMMCWFGLPILFSNLYFGSSGSAQLPAAWWWLLALPFAPVGFMPRRETLFDLMAGSQVVQYGAGAESIARAEHVQRPGILNVAGAMLLCLAVGAMLAMVTSVQRDMELRTRIAYALAQTEFLRQKVEAFHGHSQRWPAAGELGVPEWVPYRDGGGYRLLGEGAILITFTVLPELKGHSITLRPAQAVEGKAIHWQCTATVEFKRAILPRSCR